MNMNANLKKNQKLTLFYLASFILIAFLLLYERSSGSLFRLSQYESDERLVSNVNRHFSRLRLANSRKQSYVIMDESPNGYGNRLFTFMSAFLVAICTNSTQLIVKWRHMNEFVDLPVRMIRFDDAFTLANLPDGVGRHFYNIKTSVNAWSAAKSFARMQRIPATESASSSPTGCSTRSGCPSEHSAISCADSSGRGSSTFS
jgi:hypothetical protein